MGLAFRGEEVFFALVDFTLDLDLTVLAFLTGFLAAVLAFAAVLGREADLLVVALPLAAVFRVAMAAVFFTGERVLALLAVFAFGLDDFTVLVFLLGLSFFLIDLTADFTVDFTLSNAGTALRLRAPVAVGWVFLAADVLTRRAVFLAGEAGLVERLAGNLRAWGIDPVVFQSEPNFRAPVSDTKGLEEIVPRQAPVSIPRSSTNSLKRSKSPVTRAEATPIKSPTVSTTPSGS